MWKIGCFACCCLLLVSNPSPAQNFEAGPLTRLVDCAAFAEVLRIYYADYREGTNDDSFIESEERATIIRDTLVSALYSRAEKELERQQDVDAMNAQMAWVYDSARNLPELTGYGNAVSIFENRVSSCILAYR